MTALLQKNGVVHVLPVFHIQRCTCMGAYRALPVPGGEYRIACPFKHRACAFRYGAPTAPQCLNGVQIWGRAAPAVSKGVHPGLDRRCHGAGALLHRIHDEMLSPSIPRSVHLYRQATPVLCVRLCPTRACITGSSVCVGRGCCAVSSRVVFLP